MTGAARLRVRGRVQGVFFRKTTEETANSLGLSGWVRNMPDGSVEAFACGERNKVEALIEWCGKGPSGARVDAVDVEWRQGDSRLEDEIIEDGSRFRVTGGW